jgi:hypothetical protein
MKDQSVLHTPPTERWVPQLSRRRIQELGYGETATWVGLSAADGGRHGDTGEKGEPVTMSAPRGDRVIGASLPPFRFP